jgi:hypothetical protein
MLESSGKNQPQRSGHRLAHARRQRNAVRNVVDAVAAMRQVREQLFVHPLAVGDIRVHDPIVLHRQVVVVLVIAMQNQHNGAADVVHREHGQVQQVAGDHHAWSFRDDGGQSPHHGVKIFNRQRVFDCRLRVARHWLREPDVVAEVVVREHDVIRQAIRLPIRQQVRDDIHHPAHLVGHDVDDARLWGHALHARTVIDQTSALPGNGAVGGTTGGRQGCGTNSSTV